MTATSAELLPPRQRILVVDDQPEIRDVVTRALSAAGYAIDCTSDGTTGLQHALSGDYQLIILDLVMPETDGRAVLARLSQKRPGQAVLVLSCVADVPTKVDCLDLGAKDYLTKPFALDELLARVRVQLRGGQVRADLRHWRQGDHRVGDQHGGDRQLSEIIRAGQLVLDLGRLQADAGLGPIPLTRLEVLLLRELMEHVGESVPKGSLLASVWGIDFDPGSNVVDVCVRRLRSKLGFDLIETVRGAGYRLAS
ncbi:MAG: response regulator transcription factor [Streptosporangiaceae bacterium]